MLRARAFLAVPLLACPLLVLSLGACSDDGPTDPDGGTIPAAIQAQIDALFPDDPTRASATDQVEEILDAADAGQSGTAQALYFDFVAFGSDQAAAHALLDPNGAEPPTTDAALATLSTDVAEEAGLAVPDLPAAAFTDDGAVGTLDASGGTVVTGNGHAGIQLPAGALPGKVLITITRIPETGDPAEHEGPLPTALPQYPRFYDIETFPEIAELGEEGVVGLCVVDPPDPFAPSAEVVPRLRVAHPDPDAPAAIEILPLANAPFLDCSPGVASLAPSAPGQLGGRISSFSPFAAVDPTGTAPTITSVTPNPVISPTAIGASVTILVDFTDPDADIDVLRIVEISDPNGALNPIPDISVDDLAGQTSGTIDLESGCPPDAPAPCPRGTVVVDFVLLDARGNMSTPFRVTITFD